LGETGGIAPHSLTAVSEEQLKAFLEAVKADAGLQEKLKAAADADTFVAIAKAAGFVISVEEIEAQAAQPSYELSDAELERVAGGIFDTAFWCWDSETCDDFTGDYRCHC